LTHIQPKSAGQSIALERTGQKVAERYSLLTHLFAAISLAQEGIPHLLASPGTEWFAWVEITAAAALVVAAVRELKFKSAQGHETIAWTEIVAGCVLMIEAAIKWREGPRHYPLAVARALTSILVIAVGLSHARLKDSKALKIDDNGFRWRRTMFYRPRVAWADIAGISVDDRAAAFNTLTGAGPRLDLWRLKNKAEVANAIVEAAAAHGVPVTDKRKNS
jgi:hypothetical protein